MSDLIISCLPAIPAILFAVAIAWFARRRELALKAGFSMTVGLMKAAVDGEIAGLKKANERLTQELNDANRLHLLEDWHQWAGETFKQATARSCLIHLQREVGEALEAIEAAEAEDIADQLEVESEAVDVVVLAYQAARRMTGADLGNLAAAIERKFEVVKQREWGPPDADGVQEHVRGGCAK